MEEREEWTKVWSEDDNLVVDDDDDCTVLQMKAFDDAIKSGRFRQMICFKRFHVSVSIFYTLSSSVSEFKVSTFQLILKNFQLKL
jgi:hypothetical protein